ncbi:MAG: M60 family metallopeptidase [Muribaculaceae bacterium]|nr:M60 family metallopeptidase [Muribaculaceae bacterium]
MKTNTITALVAAALALAAVPAAKAQKDVPAAQGGVVLFGNNSIDLESYEGVEVEIPSYSRYTYAVSGDSWVSPRVNDGKLVLLVDENLSGSSRSALLNVRTAAGGSAVLTVRQPGWSVSDQAQAAVDATMVWPVWSKDASTSANGRANSASENIEKSYDRDQSTIYHSSYNGFDPAKESEWPVLEYYFTDKSAPVSETVEIATIAYIPRADGGSNGCFGKVDIQIGKMDADRNVTWTSIQDTPFDFGESTATTSVSVPEEMRKGIHAVRFIVRSGYNSVNSSRCFASVAEMQFKKPVAEMEGSELFADKVFSALKPGTTRAQVEAVANPLLKALGLMMIDGLYKSEGLVSTHEPIKSPWTLSEEWNAPGKLYSQYSGVTGVALTPGKYTVIVDGLTDRKSTVELGLFYWHGHELYTVADENSSDGKRDVKWGGESRSYTLYNGVNVIDIPVPNRPNKRVEGDDMCLAYINNFDDEGVENGTGSDVTVHIVGGLVNGFLSNTKTNAENKAVLDKAVYPCMDIVGTRTQGVWQTEALKQYASGEWVRLINIFDELIIWEHRVLGVEKYNRVPKNRTMAYVNYTYYMFQGALGPSFMYNTQNRVCSPINLMQNDNDAIWGLSHEWGHQHQMTPYFRWTGMAEVSNNIFSAYNVAHMGYPIDVNPGRYPTNKWQSYIDKNGVEQPGHIQKIFLNDNYNRAISAPKDGETKTANDVDNIVMSLRQDAGKAAKAGNAFGWCKELADFAQNQPKYPSRRFAPKEGEAPYAEESQNIVNSNTALNAIEAYSGNNGELILGPYVNLMFWFSEANAERPAEDYRPDLWPDLFESLRQNDRPEGSTVEKTDGVDKYELLASIFNGNKTTDPSVDKAQQFIEKYPTSVWTTKKYFKENGDHWWQQNSAPFIMNFIRKASRLTGYNLWSYFERFGCISVCALEQGDYGIQYYIMTQDMFDEFKADMEALEKDGTIRPLSDAMRDKISKVHSPSFPKVEIPNDRPILPTDN